MDRHEENMMIADAIKFFKYGKFSDRKAYIKELRTGKGASYNGFTFKESTWCWIVWKPTDIGKEAQYKGEPLCKVIPINVFIDKIPVILDAQPWTYV